MHGTGGIGEQVESCQRGLVRRCAQAEPVLAHGEDFHPNIALPPQVTNTEMFPFSAVGELTGQLGTSSRGLECTGTLIGPQHVVSTHLTRICLAGNAAHMLQIGRPSCPFLDFFPSTCIAINSAPGFTHMLWLKV